MGGCTSSHSSADGGATAQLINHDGTLQEFRHPVRVSQLLQKNPSCFICNSDDLDFGAAVSAIAADVELKPGHLYFALPTTVLMRPLPPSVIAALAVKASSALSRSRVCISSDYREDSYSHSSAAYGGDEGGCHYHRGRLTVIPE